MSQIFIFSPRPPLMGQTDIAPIPFGGECKYPCDGSKFRLPAIPLSAMDAGTGRGATYAFHIDPRLLIVFAKVSASFDFSGMT
jgi:hypothetical protein